MFGFNGNNNNSNDNKNVNTKIKTFYCELSTLQLSYWNDFISVKINPIKSVTPDGLRQYDYERRANTALSAEKCIALKEKIDSVILPKISEVAKSGKLDAAVNVGLSVGKNGSAIFFEYKNDEKGVPYVYLTLYTGIGQDNKAPSDGVYSYKFSKVATIENYDPANGTGTDDVVEAEFMFVYEKLKSITDVFGNASHSVESEKAFKPTFGNKSNNATQSQPQQQQYNAPVSNFNAEDFPFDIV